MNVSAVTVQPVPFRPLEREKHIESLFRAFTRGRRHAPEPQDTPVSRSLGDGLSPRLTEDHEHENSQGGTEKRAALELHTLKEAELRAGLSSIQEPVMAVAGEDQGLALLETVSQLRIMARPELQGPHCKPGRSYSITTGTRSQIYVAVEESSCLCLQCCGPARSCSIRGYSRQAQEVFLLERPLRADACCLGCCLMEMRAFGADRQLIGTVRQRCMKILCRWSMFTPLLEICDLDGTSNIRILGPCCPCRCYSNQEFQVVSKTGEKLGKIWKKWPGYNEDYNIDHEYFGVDVPPEMNPKSKLLLLAATFLLNHMFFEMS
ncbi:phospholipid scramblase family member 5 isoform X1 [Lepisosteus oculatus]|uniref:phospholipid scramblase family member 5 isoform X1 n=1 Tax=Lepisosteus oculatus TaxID=7918 RepID=UPI0035F5072F